MPPVNSAKANYRLLGERHADYQSRQQSLTNKPNPLLPLGSTGGGYIFSLHGTPEIHQALLRKAQRNNFLEFIYK